MRSKVQERHLAIKLRKRGKSYREIQDVVPVSKGTLSHWLCNLKLTKAEENFLSERSHILQDKGRLKTALKNKVRNEARREAVRVTARKVFNEYKDDPFFVLGLSLYWAEGAKKNGYFSFINSDVDMIKIMMSWTQEYLATSPVDCKFRLYIHKPYAHEQCERYWSRACEIPASQFQKTIYKPTPHSVKINPDYKGCLRMIIPGIKNLLIVKTWQNCLSEYYVAN